MSKKSISRREFLRVGVAGATGLAGLAALTSTQQLHANHPALQVEPTPTPGGPEYETGHVQHGTTAGGPVMPNFNSDVDHVANGFNPSDFVTEFDYGEVSTLPNGQTLREYRVFSGDKTIEVAPGIQYPAWLYNGKL